MYSYGKLEQFGMLQLRVQLVAVEKERDAYVGPTWLSVALIPVSEGRG